MQWHTIRRAAPVLALHAKRWPSDPGDVFDTSVVEPPLALLFVGVAYRLLSFILHRGGTATEGHYVAVMYLPCGSN